MADAAQTGRPRRASWLRRWYHRRLFYRLLRLLHPWPAVFYPFHRGSMLGDYRFLEVAPGSDLVIEGAQRSATSFTFCVFEVANKLAGRPPLKIARHLHAVAQYALAARWGIPALLLLRAPADCARSTVLFHDHLTPRQVLKSWIRFHRAAWRWRAQLLVVPFERATREPGSVIAAASARFGRDFAPWPATPQAQVQVLRRLEEINNQRGGDALTTFIPNDAKEAAKRAVDLRGCARLLARAEVLYRRWLAETEASFAGRERLDRPAASP